MIYRVVMSYIVRQRWQIPQTQSERGELSGVVVALTAETMQKELLKNILKCHVLPRQIALVDLAISVRKGSIIRCCRRGYR